MPWGQPGCKGVVAQVGDSEERAERRAASPLSPGPSWLLSARTLFWRPAPDFHGSQPGTSHAAALGKARVELASQSRAAWIIALCTLMLGSPSDRRPKGCFLVTPAASVATSSSLPGSRGPTHTCTELVLMAQAPPSLLRDPTCHVPATDGRGTSKVLQLHIGESAFPFRFDFDFFFSSQASVEGAPTLANRQPRYLSRDRHFAKIHPSQLHGCLPPLLVSRLDACDATRRRAVISRRFGDLFRPYLVTPISVELGAPRPGGPGAGESVGRHPAEGSHLAFLIRNATGTSDPISTPQRVVPSAPSSHRKAQRPSLQAEHPPSPRLPR